MKTLTSILVAGAVALTGVAATATGASAGGWSNGGNGGWSNDGGWYNDGPYHHRRPHVVYRQYDGTGALVAGAFLGLAIGALASPAYAEPVPPEPAYLPPPHPNFAAVDQHIAWCSQKYQTYSAERDTFVDFQGIERVCVTPYE